MTVSRADIQALIPEVVSEIAVSVVVEKTALVQSGVAVPDYGRIDLTKGGDTIRIPFIPDFTGDAEVLQEGTALTPAGFTAGEDVGVVCRRGKAWAYTTIAEIASGKDINQIIGERLGRFWAKVYDKSLLSVLKGALPNTHKNDVSQQEYGQPDITIDLNKIIDTLQLLGDNADNVEVVVMHSKVYTDLLKANLVQFPNSQTTDQLIRQGEFGTILGRRIIVSDATTVEAYTLDDGSGNTETRYRYYTYFCQPGAMYFAFQREVMTEQDKDILAQQNYLVSQAHYVPHLKGVKWNSTTLNPPDTELANPANWQKVWDDKAIRVVALITN
ncbi:hypothetical protein JCM9492_11120 [Aquifex pyrophilus]